MGLNEILELKFSGKVGLNGSIKLVDYGQGKGPEIGTWDDTLGPKPTQADLNRWAIELAPVKVAQDARQNRRNEYPPIGDQLDMLYKAMDNGTLTKVPEFYDSIKAVKDKYPVVAK